MRKECEEDSDLEDEVIQWWSCRQHGMSPEHLYFKSSINILNYAVKAEVR